MAESLVTMRAKRLPLLSAVLLFTALSTFTTGALAEPSGPGRLQLVQRDLRSAITQTRSIARSTLSVGQKARKIARAITGNLGIFRPAPVGYMVGTYDPVHAGHLDMARTFQHQLPAKSREPLSVYLVPKLQEVCPGKTPSETRHRVAMTRLAISEHPGLKTLDVKTLASFNEGGSQDFGRWVAGLKDWLAVTHPGARLYHITGTDAFNWAKDLNRQDVAAGRHVAVIPRKGYAFDSGVAPSWVTALQPRRPDKGLSSTMVRDATAAGQPLPGVHPLVARYIQSTGLYRLGPNSN